MDSEIFGVTTSAMNETLPSFQKYYNKLKNFVKEYF